jgi:amphiphysin
MERTIKLKDVYSELKTDLMEEVTMMDARLIRPAQDAMEYIQPIKKTIKKRDNKRLDWERYQDRVINYQKKTRRSDRENAAMVKAEEDLGVAATVCKLYLYTFLADRLRRSKLQMSIFKKLYLLS